MPRNRSELSAKGTILSEFCLLLFDGDKYAAAAASGVVSAQFVGVMSRGHPDENFEGALKKSLAIYETIARSARAREAYSD